MTSLSDFSIFQLQNFDGFYAIGFWLLIDYEGSVFFVNSNCVDKEEELAEAETGVAEHATQVQKVERPKRAITKPSYLKDFVWRVRWEIQQQIISDPLAWCFLDLRRYA